MSFDSEGLFSIDVPETGPAVIDMRSAFSPADLPRVGTGIVSAALRLHDYDASYTVRTRPGEPGVFFVLPHPSETALSGLKALAEGKKPNLAA